MSSAIFVVPVLLPGRLSTEKSVEEHYFTSHAISAIASPRKPVAIGRQHRVAPPRPCRVKKSNMRHVASWEKARRYGRATRVSRTCRHKYTGRSIKTGTQRSRNTKRRIAARCRRRLCRRCARGAACALPRSSFLLQGALRHICPEAEVAQNGCGVLILRRR